MGMFLQVIGGIATGLCGLALLLILAWKLFNQLLLRHLAAKTAGVRCSLEPARLHLRRTAELKWVAPEKVQALKRALTDLGFADAGCYRLGELAQPRLQGFAHEGTAVYATLYEHALTGVWLELLSRYEDGETITHTTAPEGEHLDTRPGHRKVFDRSATPADLFHRHLAERRPTGLCAAPTAEFQPVLERTYADTMDWRNARGGVTEEELRRTATATGSKLSAEEFQQLRDLHCQQASTGLDEAVRETFIRTTSLSVAQWEEQRNQLLYIHDLQLPEQNAAWFRDVFSSQDDGPEPRSDLKGLSARAAFARLNESLPADQRMRLIERISDPVEADVYLGPVVEEGSVVVKSEVWRWRPPWSKTVD